MLSASTALASLIIDPESGGEYTFIWATDKYGTEIVSIKNLDSGQWFFGESTWEITVDDTTGHYLDISFWDDFVAGDVFAFWWNGKPKAWDFSYFDSDGYFNAGINNLYLETGTHFFGLDIIEKAAGFDSGQAFGSFSEARPVPEPASMLLFGVGTLGLVGLGCRKRK